MGYVMAHPSHEIRPMLLQQKRTGRSPVGNFPHYAALAAGNGGPDAVRCRVIEGHDVALDGEPFPTRAQKAGDGSLDSGRCRGLPGHGIAPDCDVPVSACGDGVLKRFSDAARLLADMNPALVVLDLRVLSLGSLLQGAARRSPGVAPGRAGQPAHRPAFPSGARTSKTPGRACGRGLWVPLRPRPGYRKGRAGARPRTALGGPFPGRPLPRGGDDASRAPPGFSFPPLRARAGRGSSVSRDRHAAPRAGDGRGALGGDTVPRDVTPRALPLRPGRPAPGADR
ncbi:hypothetical protein Tcur_1483 [Thermomonospora curvata DSM 43183]|uniref:Uncharacterized protein n=1 Tax=Thermomonospora curvata (strain ATCC 19995 / DSM 43183 / JCM 3096 / KCTC 9072 / NBRC 15933 / NCIMB 10081 / Henssen B9) TaxID=471852 RepID=D1AAQ2_THECD|nr:hypothetical protein Tcur_1483 [Thermomonospora curvata DSM 43183]